MTQEWILRPAVEADADAVIRLLASIERERSERILLDCEETQSPEEQAEQIRWFAETPNKLFLLAEAKSELIGYGMMYAGEHEVDRRTAMLVVEITAKWHRRGVATAILKEIEKHALQHGIHRLELTALSNNTAAIELYRKLGFQPEGTRREARYIAGRFLDEIWFGKLLGSIN